MAEVALEVVDGPDKPEMIWSLAYPDREQSVMFKTRAGSVEAIVTRMDEMPDGFSFTLQGRIASGAHQGEPFTGTYSVERRAGRLLINS